MSNLKIEWREDRKRWQVTYYLDGRRKRPLFEEKPEALNFKRKIELGLAPESKDTITLEESGRKYFDMVSEKKSAKSKSNDKRYINLQFHFMTAVRGIERLGTVRLEDMQSFRDWLTVQREFDDKPMNMGPSSINRCLRTLSAFYIQHVRWGDLASNPCEYLEMLPVDENSRAAMSGEQYLKTLEKAQGWLKPVLQFMYLTGAPAICVERLRWEDVDLVKRVYSTMRKKGPRAKIKRVYQKMSAETFALLVMLRNAWPVAEGSVFRDSEGTPLLADRVTREGNSTIRAANVHGVTLYGLRHALASDLTTAGVATEIVRQAMGHGSISTTQRYANKNGNPAVARALESVRGGSLVAER